MKKFTIVACAVLGVTLTAAGLMTAAAAGAQQITPQLHEIDNSGVKPSLGPRYRL